VESAFEAGVPVIAYSRLIKSPLISAYIAFDSWAVGRAQAQAVLENASGNRFVLLGGSQTDNNALLNREGQLQILDPYIKSGDISIVADHWVENWDTQKALSVMESILTSTRNNIDAVVASNDSTAYGALQAMEAQGLAGIIPVSGQDATLAGCKSIVENKLTMTVFRDLKIIGTLAVELAEIIESNSQLNPKTVPLGSTYSIASISGDPRMRGDVFCVHLPIIPVTKENIYEVVIKTGFQDYNTVYQNIPEALRPQRP
jgi:D-xylose transport system substrate-binding protein